MDWEGFPGSPEQSREEKLAQTRRIRDKTGRGGSISTRNESQTPRSLKRRSQSYAFSRKRRDRRSVGASACCCNLHFASWHQVCDGWCSSYCHSFPASKAGCQFSPLCGQHRGPMAGGRNGEGEPKREELGQSSLPLFKMAAQASARSSRAVRVLGPQSPARRWGAGLQ